MRTFEIGCGTGRGGADGGSVAEHSGSANESIMPVEGRAAAEDSGYSSAPYEFCMRGEASGAAAQSFGTPEL